MPGLRPKATPISFDPAASGYNSPTVKSPPPNGTNGKENKKSTKETEYTQDFTNIEKQDGVQMETSGGLLSAKEVQPINSPPPKAAKLDSLQPGLRCSLFEFCTKISFQYFTKSVVM